MMFRTTLVALACSVAALATALAPRIPVPGGSYVIQDVASGLYVVSYYTESNLVPLVSEANEATVFEVTSNAQGYQILLNVEMNMYVSADPSGENVLGSTRSAASTWEEYFIGMTSTGYAILALSNSEFVSTTSAGLVNDISSLASAPSYAFVSQTAPNTEVAYLGSTRYSIQDVASGLYVTGSTNLIANGTSLSDATVFSTSPTGTNSDSDSNPPTSLQNYATDLYVTANADGTDVLTATAASANLWEEYNFYSTGTPNEYTIKALSNGLYVNTTSSGLVNSAYSQASGSIYRLINDNPGRV